MFSDTGEGIAGAVKGGARADDWELGEEGEGTLLQDQVKGIPANFFLRYRMSLGRLRKSAILFQS